MTRSWARKTIREHARRTLSWTTHCCRRRSAIYLSLLHRRRIQVRFRRAHRQFPAHRLAANDQSTNFLHSRFIKTATMMTMILSCAPSNFAGRTINTWLTERIAVRRKRIMRHGTHILTMRRTPASTSKIQWCQPPTRLCISWTTTTIWITCSSRPVYPLTTVLTSARSWKQNTTEK